MGAGKQLNIDMRFNADISQAKKNLNDLQNSLTKIASMSSNKSLPLTNDIKEASKAAADLQGHLNAAFDSKTGNVNVNKLNASLSKSGQTLSSLSTSLLKAGMDGEKSFMQIQKALVSSNLQLTKAQSQMEKFSVALRNTARWQISSSILHGFMGTLQSAYGYAQDLNKSLNNIRIVTGQSTDQMAKFAKQANLAAQQLSTTTAKYADASLIYYQQGLSDRVVKERTEATIKMANVAHESANEVSSYMTAIWNNFNKAGDKSAEHFGDVLTKLGATTAASTAELAGGLEKFAAVADTIGLSYDYATAALATIIDKTRQSEDVVGTSLKTIFARMQGLKLGESLDDGTNLNQYSSALAKIGVQVTDSSGELRKMDDILNDLGARWNDLTKAQQVATAQTVAGVRQYTQLVALMDNWSSFQQNVATAQTADGELQKQADIYAESWEAASKRAKAALEDIYDSLLDDKFFIKLTNGFAGVTKVVGGLVDAMGGFKGVMFLASSILIKQFQPNLTRSLDSGIEKVKQLKADLTDALKDLRNPGRERSAEEIQAAEDRQLPTDARMATQNIRDTKKKIAENKMPVTAEFKSQLDSLEKINNLNNEILRKRHQLTEDEKEKLSIQLQETMNLSEQSAEAKKQLEIIKQQIEINQDQAFGETADYGAEFFFKEDSLEIGGAFVGMIKEFQGSATDLTKLFAQIGVSVETTSDKTGILFDNVSDLYEVQGTILNDLTKYGGLLENVNSINKDVLTSTEKQNEAFKQIINELRSDPSDKYAIDLADELDKIVDSSGTFEEKQAAISRKIRESTTAMMLLGKQSSLNVGTMEKAIELGRKRAAQQNRVNVAVAQEGTKLGEVKQLLDQLTDRSSGLSGNLIKGFQSISSFGFQLTSLTSSFQRLTDSSATFTQKVTAASMMIGVIGKSLVGTILPTAQKIVSAISTATVANGGSLLKDLQDKGKNVNKDIFDFASNGIKKVGNSSRGLKNTSVEQLTEIIKTKYKDIDATTAQAVAEAMHQKAVKGGGIEAARAAGEEALLAEQKKVSTKVTWKQVAANLGLKTSMIEIYAIIAFVAVAIGAVVGAYKLWQQSYNKDAIAAQNAAKTAKNLAERYNDVKTAYEDMISAMDNYNSALKGLEKLTKGTEEYADALEKANRAAMELLSKSNDFTSDDYYYDNEGKLIIKDEAQTRIKAEMRQQEQEAYSASLIATAAANQANTKSKITNFKRSSRDDIGLGDGASALKSIAGAVLMLTPGTRALGAGLAASAGVDAYQASSYDAAVDQIVQNPEKFGGNLESFTEALKEIGVTDSKLINALWENKSSLEDLSQDIKHNTAQEKVAYEQAGRKAVEGLGFENSKSGEQALNQAGAVQEAAYKKALDKYQNTQTNVLWWGTQEGKDMANRYAEMAGLNKLTGFKITNIGNNGGFDYTYYDENGEKKKATILQDQINIELANADAANEVTQSLIKLKNKIDELNKTGNVKDSAFAGFLSNGNLEGSTKTEFDAIKEAVNNDSLGYLQEQGYDDASAKELGYTNLQAMADALQKSLAIDFKIDNSVSDKIRDVITHSGATAIENLEKEIGTAGKDAFVGLLNSFNLSNLSTDKQKEFIQDITNLNAQSYTFASDVSKKAREYGIYFDASSEQAAGFFDTLKSSSGAVADMAELSNTLQEIDEITKNLKIGDIITPESFEKLTKYTSELGNFFTILADGSALFNGDKLDLQQAMKQAPIKQYEQTQIDAARSINQSNSKLESLNKQKDSLEKEITTISNNSSELSEHKAALENAKANNSDIKTIESVEKNLKDTENQLGITKKKQELADINKQILKEESNITTQETAFDTARQNLALAARNGAERRQFLQEGRIKFQDSMLGANTAYQNEKYENLDITEVDNYAKHLQKALNIGEEASEDVAAATMKMNNGVKKLSDGIKSWSDVLRNSDASSQEYAESLEKVRNAMSDVLGVSEEYLSDKFLIDNFKDIEAAANGDADAIDRLAKAAGSDILLNVVGQEKFDSTFKSLYDSLINDEALDISVGMTLDDAQAIQGLQNIIEQAGMTADEANAFLSSIGFEPTWDIEDEKINRTAQGSITESVVTKVEGTPGTVGYRVETQTFTRQGDLTQISDTIPVYAMAANGKTPKIKKLTKQTNGSMNNFSSINKGSSGSSKAPKNHKATAKDGVVERYKEINDKIDDLSDAMSDLNKQSDKLWGTQRLKAMEKQSKLLQKEIELNKEKLKEAKAYLQVDKQALAQEAKKAGAELKIDENGLITNYTEELSRLWDQYHAIEEKYNNASNWGTSDAQNQYKEDTVDPAKEKLDNLIAAIKKYDDTRELIEDLENTIDDAFNNWQEKNYNIINETLKMKIEIDDSQLQILDYFVNKLSKDFYQFAEAVEYLGQKAGSYSDELGTYSEAYQSLLDAYNPDDKAHSKISQSQFVEGLKEQQSGILGVLGNLESLDDEMIEYYSKTLDKGAEELAKYTDKMDHLNDVLDHYKSLITLINGEYDYGRIGTILEGAAANRRNQMDVATANYQMLLAQQAAKQAQRDAVDPASKAWEMYNAELEAAIAATNEAESQMLEATEDWANAMKEVMTNTMEQAAAEMEKAFSGGLGYDELNRRMDRQQAVQDEYLTKQNQLYETQKLMNKAQQDADKTSNQAAKNRIAAYIQETQELQNKGKMSNYELEIQKAKYTLLLAQIAAEEAQNAKSTVRLRRDSEGNFGYVYTADQNKIAEAQDALMTAENDLYNIGLRGANEYSQKIIQLQQQLSEDLKQLEDDRVNGLIQTDEEYAERRDEILKTYETTYQAYTDALKEANETHAQVARDAWVENAYPEILNKASEWNDTVTQYSQEATDAYKKFIEETEPRINEINNLINDTAGAVQENVDANKALADALLNEDDGVIKAINDEYNAVTQVTKAYAEQRDEISKTIKEYEVMVQKIQNAIEEEYRRWRQEQEHKNQSQADTIGKYDDSGLTPKVPGPAGPGDNKGNPPPPSPPPGQEDQKDPDLDDLRWSKSLPWIKIKKGSVEYFFDNVSPDGYKQKGEQRFKTFDKDTYITVDSAMFQRDNRLFIRSHDGHMIDYFFNMSDILGAKGLPVRSGGGGGQMYTKLDTGGYTGEWGPDGKFAMLHEKEIVLNKNDTANLLASVSLIRDIVSAIDLGATRAAMGSGLLAAGALTRAGANQLEQQVHIEASFPGVTDRNEIQEAFNNLINTASQYINRKTL